MKSIGAFEAKTHFSQLLDAVNQGEKIVITKHGKSVAILTPFQEDTHVKAKSALQRLENFRQSKKIHFSLDEIKTMKEKGRA